jgi:rubrerythrin
MERWRHEVVELCADRQENPYPTPIYSLHMIEDRVAADRDDAIEILEAYASEQRDRYRDAAVRFHMEAKDTKKVENMLSRLKRLEDQKTKTHDDALPSRRKGARTTCAACGSALSNRHMGERDRCPVCHESLLSATAKTRIGNLESRIAACKRDIKKERKRLAKDAPIMWLARASCHN